MSAAAAGGRTIAIIPARYSSVRFPGKPLADIAGKPMIQHVVERARAASLIDGVVVAPDDDRIAGAVRKFGGRAVMTPACLATGTDRVAYAARELEEAEIVVNVQGDEPLILPEMIDQAVRPLREDTAMQAGTLVKRITEAAELGNPNVVKVVLDRCGRCLYFSRSPIPFGRDGGQAQWTARHPYYKHIGLYVFRRDFLLQFAALEHTPLEQMEKLEQLRILEHGFGITAAVTTLDSVAVDTPADLERVRTLIRSTP